MERFSLFRVCALAPPPTSVLIGPKFATRSSERNGARARRDAGEKWQDDSELCQCERASGVESVARISKEINRSNWSSSAMVGDHTISGESALTQRPKNGLSCKMVLQAVGKVLR